VTDSSKSSASLSTEEYLRQHQDDEPHSGSNALKVVLIAVVLVVAAIGAYVYFGEKPPVAAGEIVHLTAVPIHQESHMPAAAGMPGQQEAFDQVLVLAQVKLRNQSKIPLFLNDMFASLQLPEDLERRSLAVNRTDFARAFIAYPQLLPLKGDPIVRDVTIEPGQSIEGMMLFPFPMTRDDYEKRKSLDIEVIFLHQKTLVLRAPQ
jgi:hypothetical protein